MKTLFEANANPAFFAYVVTCLVLSLNLLMLWVSSGATRAKGGVAINPESRVKSTQGAARPRLVQNGWSVFLVKVPLARHN